MIFQHTLDKVLSGQKTQTSRLWQDHWGGVLEANNSVTVFNGNTGRRLYYAGQIRSVQAGRGVKGVAEIEILRVRKLQVLNFEQRDIELEGFNNRHEFLGLWREMHPHFMAVVLNFRLITLYKK